MPLLAMLLGSVGSFPNFKQKAPVDESGVDAGDRATVDRRAADEESPRTSPLATSRSKPEFMNCR
jgi:hypothetical protein